MMAASILACGELGSESEEQALQVGAWTPMTFSPDLRPHTRLPAVVNLTPATCVEDGVPVVSSLLATHHPDGSIDVTVRGNDCGAHFVDFDYQAFTSADEQVITRAQYGQIDTLHRADDGTFVFIGSARSSCGTLHTARRIEVTLGEQGPYVAPVAAPHFCTPDLVPVLARAEAWKTEEGQIPVILEGDACGGEIATFSFRIFDSQGRDITGRSWPEVDEVVMQDGRFEVHGVAAGCADYRDAARLELNVWRSFEFQSASETLSIDIAR